MSDNIGPHIRKDVITNGVSNAIFNGLAAWPMFKSVEMLPMWGNPSIAFDIAGTSVVLLFIVALIFIPVARMKRRKGKLPAFEWDDSKFLHRFFRGFPKNLLLRALCFAGLGLFVVAPLTYIPYILLGVEGMPGSTYAIVKGLWAGVMAAVMCIPMLLIGLSDPQPATEEAAQ